MRKKIQFKHSRKNKLSRIKFAYMKMHDNNGFDAALRSVIINAVDVCYRCWKFELI